MTLLETYTLVMCTVGVVFFYAGTLGLWRFPDVFSRLHALTKADNLGLGLITLGVLPQVDSLFDVAQLLLIWFAVMLSGAVSCYLVTTNSVAELNRNMPLKLTVFETTEESKK